MLAELSRFSGKPLLTFLPVLLAFGLATGLNAEPRAQDTAKSSADQEKTKSAAPATPEGDYVGSDHGGHGNESGSSQR